MVNFLPIQQHLKIRYNLYHRQNWVITGLWSWSPLQNEDDLFSFVLLFEIQILSKTRLSNNKPKLMLPHAEDNEKHFLCCGLISEWGRKGILERGNVFGASFLHFETFLRDLSSLVRHDWNQGWEGKRETGGELFVAKESTGLTFFIQSILKKKKKVLQLR